MASAAIKGLTVKIGADTGELGKALDSIEKKSRGLSKELGEVNRLLKMDPGNADLLAQKQEILAEAVEKTKEKLETLKEAEAQVQEQFERGEVSAEQVRALQREIAATEQKLKGYERAVGETADELRNLGNNAEQAAEGVDDTADAADDAEDETEELESSLDGLGGAFAAVAAAAGAAIAALVGCVEASHEYRTAMGKLDTAFTTNGHSAEVAYETYAALQGVLGESDQAVEAANHLAVLTDNEADLARWTEICTGIFATFGDSLPIEGLTEAANETAKVGQVTGPLADALNWAGISEEKFNEALAECNDEQARQTLIMKTLTNLYGDAAKAYRKTNKEVIAANEANERWNKAVAEIGENMAPVVTEVKNFGSEMLESMAEPLGDLADFIRTEFLPNLSSIANWVRSNGPVIKATLAGITAAIVAYKVATIATEVAHKGLKGAILATAAAEKVLQLVQAASPWGLIATAIGAVVVAMTAYAVATREVVPEIETLSDEERELIESARETAEAFREQKAATEEALGNAAAESKHVQDLANELFTLADASGKVEEKDRSRAQFILGELNAALGTEYQMVDGVIQQYTELETSIHDVIQAKLANSLIEAANADYVTAIQSESEALKAVLTAEQDYMEYKGIVAQKEEEYTAKRVELQQQIDEAWRTGGDALAIFLAQELDALDQGWAKTQETLAGKKEAYDEAAVNYGAYSDTIAEYEAAQTAVLEGNYDKAVDILTDKGEIFGEYSDTVDAETAKVLDTLYKEAVDAGLEAERTRENFEKGIEGYTEDMVTEAEEGYAAALEAYATAKTDAEGVGADIGSGLASGMESKRTSVISKVRSIVNNIISAARAAADSHSPSRKMIAFGEDMGEGTEIGLENRTKNLLATARKQVDSLMTEYADAGEDLSQTAYTNVSRQTATREAQAYQTAMSGNADKLDKILAAIERGQVLTIDSKTLVGGTATMYDNELGRRRALAARGAL